MPATDQDEFWMRQAIRLARRGCGFTSPNPIVGAVLVKNDSLIGRGWHQRAGQPHAEIEAIQDALQQGRRTAGATLYVTLEPCSTQGRTPPCSAAIVGARITRVIIGAIDPNPAHSGRALGWLRRRRIRVTTGVLETECTRLNPAFNHWIVHRTPYVTLKSAMTLDGKIGTCTGESKWITGAESRAYAMKLRHAADAILAGINTVLADDPQLTCRIARRAKVKAAQSRPRWRVILDSRARTPLDAKVLRESPTAPTIVVVTRKAPLRRRNQIAKKATVWIAPSRRGHIDLGWVLERLGKLGVSHLLVEGGGEILGSFIDENRAQAVAFFYAPMVLGGRDSLKAVAGIGASKRQGLRILGNVRLQRLGPDLLLTADLIRPTQ